MKFSTLMKNPMAWLPLALSFAALVFIFAYVAQMSMTGGLARSADEGAPARIFQLAMFVEVVLIGFFALRWLPREPRQGAKVLALQIFSWIVPIAVIMLLESKIA